MASKVLAYLQERAGQEVTVGEMVEAGLSASQGTLMAHLSRLVNDPRSGVTRVGLTKRTHGVNRPYRYDPVPPEVKLVITVIGSTDDGCMLGKDAAGTLYRLQSLGMMG